MPFMFFNKNQNGKPAGSGIGPGMAGQLACNGYQRKITMIRKTSTMCMVAEAAGINWVMGGTGLHAEEGHYRRRRQLDARPGRPPRQRPQPPSRLGEHRLLRRTRQPDGDHARSRPTIDGSGQGGGTLIPQSVGVVFTINRRDNSPPSRAERSRCPPKCLYRGAVRLSGTRPGLRLTQIAGASASVRIRLTRSFAATKVWPATKRSCIVPGARAALSFGSLWGQ